LASGQCFSVTCYAETGFKGGFAFFVGFPNGVVCFFCASRFCVLETLMGEKERLANERHTFSQKNENKILYREMKNATSGFENEKHLSFPNSSFANSD